LLFVIFLARATLMSAFCFDVYASLLGLDIYAPTYICPYKARTSFSSLLLQRVRVREIVQAESISLLTHCGYATTISKASLFKFASQGKNLRIH